MRSLWQYTCKLSTVVVCGRGTGNTGDRVGGFSFFAGHSFIKFSTVEIYSIVLLTYTPELQRSESSSSFPDPAEAGGEEQGADNG